MTDRGTTEHLARGIALVELDDLPRIPRNEAVLRTALARHRVDAITARAWIADLRRELVALQGPGAEIPADELLQVHQFGPALECGDPFGARLRVRAFLRLARGDAALELDLAAVRGALAAMIGVEDDAFARSDLLTQLEEGALAHAIDRLAVRTEIARARGPVQLRGIGTESADLPWPPDETIAIVGDATLAGRRLVFRLLVPRATLATPPSSVVRSFDALGLSDLALSFAAEAGHASLRPSDIAGLEANDIVLLDAADIAFEDGALIGEPLYRAEGVGAGPGFRARLGDGGSRVELTAFERGAAEAAEEECMSSAEVGSGEALLPELPLRLRVEMGRVQLTVAQLSSLNVGAVIELHRDPKSPVSLWVEDRRIGAGELVSVDGQLGVRITELG